VGILEPEPEQCGKYSPLLHFSCGKRAEEWLKPLARDPYHHHPLQGKNALYSSFFLANYMTFIMR